MLKKISHIGIAVQNLEEAIKVFESLGLKIDLREEVGDQKVRVACFPIGESRIELLEATDPESPVQKFIDKKGPGLHHLAFEVDGSLDTAIETCQNLGIRMVDETPRKGAHSMNIAFCHPKSTAGSLIELCVPQKKED